jgi:hypothetical protein
MLALRWAELDPRHMFATLRAEHRRHPGGGGLADDYFVRQTLFDTWAKHDPEAAIAALQDRSALPGVEGQRMSLTNTLMKSDPSRALKLIADWSITSYLPNLDGVPAWAARDPRAAAEAAMKANSDIVTGEVMKHVGKVWSSIDPAGALAFAVSSRGLAGIQLAQSAMAAWAEKDLAAAIAHVEAQSETLTKAKLGLPLIEAWARNDPRGALAWANENLKGEARAAAAASVVKTMAAEDIQGAARFIGSLDPGGAKDRAIGQLIEIWLGNDSYDSTNGAKATAALTWMTSLPEAEAHQQAAQAAWRLMHYAPEATIEFLNSPQGSAAPQALFDRAAGHLARRNPESAMAWAAGLAPDVRDGAQRAVLDEWTNSRPEAAMDWVRRMPEGENRASSVASLTTTLSYSSTDTARRWLESLPAADRPAALSGLKRNGALSGPDRAALEAALR